MVRFILLYGKEIWELEKYEKSIGIFIHSLYKKVLGGAKSSPNSAIKLELEEISIKATILKYFSYKILPRIFEYKLFGDKKTCQTYSAWVVPDRSAIACEKYSFIVFVFKMGLL